MDLCIKICEKGKTFKQNSDLSKMVVKMSKAAKIKVLIIAVTLLASALGVVLLGDPIGPFPI